MSIKKIIILSVLVIISFAVSFAVTSLTGGDAPPADRQAQGEDASPPPQAEAEAAATVIAGRRLSPKERLVDELARELRHKIAEHKRKQRVFEQREKRIRLAEAHLKKQAEALETLRIELVAPLTNLKEAQARLERSRIVIARQERTNLKRTAAIYEKMDAASGSKILSDMYANGQTDDVVKILYYMSERSAAKVLAEMSAKKIAAVLCEKMKTLEEEG